MRTLITGGAGFIGSHLAEESVARGYETRVLDDLSTGKPGNLAAMTDQVELTVGDIRDLDLVRKVVDGVDYVFHHAAQASVPLTVEDPITSAEINDLGTLNLFKAAADAGVRRVIFASSSAVYGLHPPPHHEKLPPHPNSPYAAHKLIGEYYGAMFKDLYGLEVVSLRYFNVFGPRQDPSSPYSGVISIFMDRLERGDPLVVYGDGGQSRDFVFVKDVARLNFHCTQLPGAAGGVFNVGGGRPVTLNEMIEVLSALIGRRPEVQYAPPRPGDIYASWASVDKARKELGFTAQTSVEDGLAETWAARREE